MLYYLEVAFWVVVATSGGLLCLTSLVGVFGKRDSFLDETDLHYPSRIMLFLVGVLILVFGFIMLPSYPISQKVTEVRAQGQAIGSRLSSNFLGYTSFGDGKSGTIIANGSDFGSLLVSPMKNAVGGRGTRIVDVYGVESFINSGEGPGIINVLDKTHYNTYNISSGNYGTKSTGTDLSWCFVLNDKGRDLHDKRVWVKFTNKANGYPWSLKPLLCVNGK